VITVALKTHLKKDWESVFTKLYFCIGPMTIGFASSCPPTFYIKIAPMVTGNNYHSVFVALMLLSGLPDPVFKKKENVLSLY